MNQQQPAAEHNVVSFLHESARQAGQRVALVVPRGRDERQVTFRELKDQVDRVSGTLRQLGLAPGQRVIIMIPMSIELYAVLLGVLQVGAVAIFIDPWMSRQQIATFAAYAQPSAFIGIGKSHLLRRFHAALRSIELTVTTGWRIGPIPASHTLKNLLSGRPDPRICPVSPRNTALVSFTTGSSGDPKGANRTHGFLDAQRDALRHEFPYRDSDVDMPMFPVFALNNLAAGRTSIVPKIDFKNVRKANGELIGEQIRRHGVTTCTASPPFFDRLAEAPGPHTTGLRRILTGGAPVTDDQLAAWQSAFADTEITVVYGSTEAEPVAHLDARQRLELSGGAPPGRGYCVGKPTPLLDSRLVRITQHPIVLDERGWGPWSVSEGEVGELVVSGPHVCRDYFRNQLAARENKIVTGDGRTWHRMGDTGYFDAERRFWLVGRVHSTISRANQLYHPHVCEQIVQHQLQLPPPEQVAVVGIEDPHLGQRLVVVVSTDRNGPDTIKAVRCALESRRIPFDDVCVLRDRLPVDPRHNSKIDYDVVRTLVLRRAGR